MSMFILLALFSFIAREVFSIDCQYQNDVNGNYSWPDTSGVPKNFKPLNGKNCQWIITVPNGTYITITIDGEFNQYDMFRIEDSSRIGAAYNGQLHGYYPETYYLPAGNNSFQLNCSAGTNFNSTISIQIRYYILPTTKSKTIQFHKNTPILVNGNEFFNQPTTINIADANRNIVLSAAANSLTTSDIASYMIYEGDSLLGKPRGSMFFYALLTPPFNSSNIVTIVNLKNDVPSVVLINDLENMLGIDNYYFAWNGGKTAFEFYITLLKSTSNGPAAMTTYRSNGEAEYINFLSFQGTLNSNSKFDILDGPPMLQHNTLYTYRPNANLSNLVPVQVSGVLNTFVAYESQVGLGISDNLTITKDQFLTPSFGRQGFLASQNSFLPKGRNKTITFVDNAYVRYKFAITYARMHFDQNSPGGIFTVTIYDADNNNNTYVKQQANVTTNAEIIIPLVNATGYSMTIDYIESPNHNSDFYVQFEFGYPDNYNPTGLFIVIFLRKKISKYFSSVHDNT